MDRMDWIIILVFFQLLVSLGILLLLILFWLFLQGFAAAANHASILLPLTSLLYSF